MKDGAVLIHLGTNQIYDLNQTGFRVWQLLQEGLDYSTLLAQIAQEFDVDQPQLAEEVDTLLAHLSAEHLLEGDRDGAGPGA